MTLTGRDFLSACSRPDPEWISFCHGYVQAVVDGVRHPTERPCLPDGLTRARIVSVVVVRLNAMPDLREINAASVVYGILTREFPCQ